MLRAIETFPLAPSVRTTLTRAGFRVAKDVLDLSPLALASELGVPRVCTISERNSRGSSDAREDGWAGCYLKREERLRMAGKMRESCITHPSDWASAFPLQCPAPQKSGQS